MLYIYVMIVPLSLVSKEYICMYIYLYIYKYMFIYMLYIYIYIYIMIVPLSLVSKEYMLASKQSIIIQKVGQ